MTEKRYSDAKQKELETRERLGPRLPRSRPASGRVYGGTPQTIRRRRNRPTESHSE